MTRFNEAASSITWFVMQYDGSIMYFKELSQPRWDNSTWFYVPDGPKPLLLSYWSATPCRVNEWDCGTVDVPLEITFPPQANFLPFASKSFPTIPQSHFRHFQSFHLWSSVISSCVPLRKEEKKESSTKTSVQTIILFHPTCLRYQNSKFKLYLGTFLSTNNFFFVFKLN